MNDKLYQAFDSIKAEKSLKEHTLSFLQKESDKKFNHAIHSFRRYAVLAASFLFLFFAGGSSYYLYFSPVTYIDVDVNPSIELSANQFGRIVDASAYNREGETLLSSVDLKHQSYETALSLLIQEMDQENYLTNESLLSITVQSDHNADEFLKQIEQTIENMLTERHLSTEQELFAVDTETRSRAHSLNVSPAKYLAILDLQKVDPTATVESCKHHSISDLKNYTQQYWLNNNNEQVNTNPSEDDTEQNATDSVNNDNSHEHSFRHGHHNE